MNRSDFLEDLLDGIANLPEEMRIEALVDCFASTLKLMDRKTVIELRTQLFTRRFPDPAYEPVINLIDGHLILREIHSSL